MNKTLAAIRVGMEIMQGKHRENLIPGVELMEKMCELARDEGKSVYFFGGWENRAELTARNLKFKISNLKCGWSAGEPYESDEVSLRKINDFKPDFLFVARGMKKQEEWIERHLDELKVRVVMGVGRSFDYLSGDLRRAPESIRKVGFEWLFSLIMEPKRWKRQLVLPRFVWKALTE